MTSSGKPRKSKQIAKRNDATLPSRSSRWAVGGSTDNMAPEHRRRTMASVRARDTAPELLVRRIAHNLGFRFRLCRRDLPGCPDIVFPRLRRVIFVHGCFWHSHTCKKGRRRPRNNAKLWREKLERNVVRHRNATRKLRRMGWQVLTLWECQLNDVPRLTRRIERFLEGD